MRKCADDKNIILEPEARSIFGLITEALQQGYIIPYKEEIIKLNSDIISIGVDNMQKEYEFYSLGMGGKSIIKINGNTLTISRPGLMSKMSLGFTGEKTVMINQISGVQIKKVGLARGYIQFIKRKIVYVVELL